VGFVTLPLVSRWTAHWKPARMLVNLAHEESLAASAQKSA